MYKRLGRPQAFPPGSHDPAHNTIAILHGVSYIQSERITSCNYHSSLLHSLCICDCLIPKMEVVRWAARGVVLALAAAAALAAVTIEGNLDASTAAQRIWLETRVPLSAWSADNDSAGGKTFSWPLHVPSGDLFCQRVVNVSVDVVGLQHPRSQDVKITLRHGSASAVLVRGTGTGRRFGVDDADPIKTFSRNRATSMQAEAPVLSFRDPPARNLALGAAATSSSVLSGGAAARAVDGVLDGFFATAGVALTGPATHGINSWLDVDLGSAQPVGSVRLYDRAFEAYLPAIQTVEVAALSTVRGGSFKLRVTVGGQTLDTAELSPFAPGPRLDETTGDPTRVGISMEAALSALVMGGDVAVTRELVDAGRKLFAWRVTFTNRGDVRITGAVPGSDAGIVASNPAVRVTTQQLGADHSWQDDSGRVAHVFHACQAAADACADPTCASGTAPGWLILSNTKLDSMPLADALRDSSVVYKQRLECTLPRSREMVVSLPGQRTARYVRIQRADEAALWVAEVQVYAQSVHSLSAYRFGSNIVPAQYASEESLTAAFRGMAAHGAWLLEVTTAGAPALVAPADVRTSQAAHESRAPPSMSTWVLHLGCDGAAPEEAVAVPVPHTAPVMSDAAAVANGISSVATAQRSYEAGVVVTVHAWPTGGHLAAYNATAITGITGAAGTASNMLAAQVIAGAATATGEGRYVSDSGPCLPGMKLAPLADGAQMGCVASQVVGKQRTDGALPYTGDVAATLAAADGALAGGTVLTLDWLHNRHSVVYSPVQGFRGQDSIPYSPSYTDALGGVAAFDPAATEEAQGVNTVHVTVTGRGGAVAAALAARADARSRV